MMEEHLCIGCLSKTCPNAGYNTSIKKCAVYIQPKPITNADRIRSMSDEELADKFEEIELNAVKAYGNDYMLLAGELREYWLDWLKKKAEEPKKEVSDNNAILKIEEK